MQKRPRWQVIYRYLCRSAKDPESLSRGVGLGLFIGFLPSFGYQTILAFFSAGIFQANRIVTVLGTLVTNPFTVIPVSAFSIWLGDHLLPGTDLSDFSMKNIEPSELIHSSGQLGLAYIVGCLALAITAGVVGYAAMKFYFSIRTQP